MRRCCREPTNTSHDPSGGRAPNELLEIGRSDSWRNIFFTTSTAVAVVNSIVAGAGIALALDVLAFTGQQAILTGVVAAAVMSVLHGVYQRHRYTVVKRLIYAEDALTLLRSAGDNDG